MTYTFTFGGNFVPGRYDTMATVYDYAIIGGGVAGLYANYKLAKKGNGILLEKNSNAIGRMREHEFHGVKVKCGAGIGVPENKVLTRLLKKFGMPHKSVNSPAIVDLREPKFDMKSAVKEVKKVYKTMTKKDLSTLTAEEILYKYFPEEFAEQFIHHSEFNDYLDGSFEYLFKYYDIDDLDNASFPKIFVDWEKLAEHLRLPNITTGYTVETIEKKRDVFVVNNDIVAKQIILALTVDALDDIKYIGFTMPVYNEYIGSVPFARVYAYYEKGYKLNYGYAMVDGPLDKLVKINDKVLMASYADSKNALFWMLVKTLNKDGRRKIINDELKRIGFDFGMPDDVFSAEWKSGVHYFKPYPVDKFEKLLDTLSKPRKNVFVIGEMLSKRQGYVEGALLSVDRVFK
ncbi:amino oxidase [Acanthocystis turfacea Chlorella virus MN0810.1]|nr:amino oxidase [Acanthocystis turfacea Chlorella virus MN0810.1]